MNYPIDRFILMSQRGTRAADLITGINEQYLVTKKRTQTILVTSVLCIRYEENTRDEATIKKKVFDGIVKMVEKCT